LADPAPRAAAPAKARAAPLRSPLVKVGLMGLMSGNRVECRPGWAKLFYHSTKSAEVGLSPTGSSICWQTHTAGRNRSALDPGGAPRQTGGHRGL
jgi:hypothetical protein